MLSHNVATYYLFFTRNFHLMKCFFMCKYFSTHITENCFFFTYEIGLCGPLYTRKYLVLHFVICSSFISIVANSSLQYPTIHQANNITQIIFQQNVFIGSLNGWTVEVITNLLISQKWFSFQIHQCYPAVSNSCKHCWPVACSNIVWTSNLQV